MDLKEELTRQGLLLEFISECVSLQGVPDLAKLITGRLHWICDYDTCTTLLPDAQGLSMRSQERRAGAGSVIEDDVLLSSHRIALEGAMARGSPTLAQSGEGGMFLAALPLGSGASIHGALCVGRAASGFSQGDVRHLRHAASAVGGALTRIEALAAERLAEATLRQSEARYRTLFEAIDEGFCVVQFVDGPRGPLSDCVHLEANPAYLRYSGVPDIVGQTGFTALAADEADAWVASFRSVLATGEPVRFERELAASGRHLEVACTRIEPAAIRQVAITLQDVSARKRAERRLRELNETLESQVAERTAERDRMWDTSPDLMLVIDFDGFFRRVNPAWTALLGYTHGELVGHHVNEFVIPDDHRETTGAYEAAAGGGRPKLENRYRHKDGSIRWVAWVAAPAGEVTYATGRDITAEKLGETELAEAQEALRQAQKMEAVGQLTGGIAHDFNNLLAAISGGLQVVKLRLARGQTEGLDRYVDIGETSIRRAAALTQRLLAFSRRQTLDPKPVNVNRMVSGMEDLIRRTVGPNIELEVVGAGGLWTTRVDPSQLENVLLNLCINARDAMLPRGGRLTIETANKWLDDRAAAERELPPGHYISLCVTDTGTGIAPELVKLIFDPFFTTKPTGQGTGLGLSMVYGFARQSGGQIRVYTEPGHGTTMCVYLPRHMGEAEEEAAAGPASVFATGDGETVVIVEDEESIRMLVVEVLEEAGYRVLQAADGPAGLRLLQSSGSVDLLVTDVGLPGGLNGRQVADAARALRPELKVLFLTGYAENAAVGNGLMEAGMQVMTKPFDIDRLTGKVREMLMPNPGSRPSRSRSVGPA